MKPVIVIEADGLQEGEETKLLEMLKKCIYGNSETAPPARVTWRMRLLTNEEQELLKNDN